MSNRNKLTGVVLCGGESRRMGRDKGSLLRDGIPWAGFMASKLESRHIPTIFSINATQEQQYRSVLRGAEFIIDDAHTGRGPVRGLLSVHRRYPAADLLLLACDMLDLDDSVIGELVDSWRVDDGYDFFVYVDGGHIQPFCGIYTAGGLSLMWERSVRTRWKDMSLTGMLNQGRTKKLTPISVGAFANYNSM